MQAAAERPWPRGRDTSGRARKPRSAKVRCTVMPTTAGKGWHGGGPESRFSSQYDTRQSGGVLPAMLVSARLGVRTCLPKLACGSLG